MFQLEVDSTLPGTHFLFASIGRKSPSGDLYFPMPLGDCGGSLAAIRVDGELPTRMRYTALERTRPQNPISSVAQSVRDVIERHRNGYDLTLAG